VSAMSFLHRLWRDTVCALETAANQVPATLEVAS